MSNLENMTLAELKKIAKENNIKNISKLKKDELITMIGQIVGEQSEKDINNNSGNNNNNFENNVETKKNINETNIEDEKKEISERQYDENGEPIIDYKLTNEGDEIVEGILDILPDGYGFLRDENFMSSEKDVYISMVQIRRFKLDTGDIIKGISRFREGEKFPSLIFVGEVNGEHPEKAMKRKRFDELTPIYPNKRLKLETDQKIMLQE